MITIMSGIPGSGKSSYVQDIKTDKTIVVSADHYFMKDGVYTFKPSDLHLAHKACMRAFIDAAQLWMHKENPDFVKNVIVDNTNTTYHEISPYLHVGLAYGHEVELVTMMCDVEVAHGRNTHGVSLDTCHKMQKKLLQRDIPPFGLFQRQKEVWTSERRLPGIAKGFRR